MYKLNFYRKENGDSELLAFLEGLRNKAGTSKDARIQFKQIAYCMQLLEENGTRLPESITKHLEDDIWELRPGFNRIFYFYHKDDTFVLLHHFRKKSQKTPRREIDKAKSEQDDFLRREGGWKDYENRK